MQTFYNQETLEEFKEIYEAQNRKELEEEMDSRKDQLEKMGWVLKDRTAEIGRNDPCLCGSGKKFKKCCIELARKPSQVVWEDRSKYNSDGSKKDG